MGVVARRSTRAIGHRHEAWRQRFELGDGAKQSIPTRVTLGREELEAQRESVARENVREVHGGEG